MRLACPFSEEQSALEQKSTFNLFIALQTSIQDFVLVCFGCGQLLIGERRHFALGSAEIPLGSRVLTANGPRLWNSDLCLACLFWYDLFPQLQFLLWPVRSLANLYSCCTIQGMEAGAVQAEQPPGAIPSLPK